MLRLVPTYRIQSLDSGPGSKGRGWLVECDVPVGANATDEELDASGMRNLFLERGTFGLEVRCHAVEDMEVVGVNVNMLKKSSTLGLAQEKEM